MEWTLPLKGMIFHDPNERPPASVALKHPTFWSTSKTREPLAENIEGTQTYQTQSTAIKSESIEKKSEKFKVPK